MGKAAEKENSAKRMKKQGMDTTLRKKVIQVVFSAAWREHEKVFEICRNRILHGFADCISYGNRYTACGSI